MKIYWDEVLRFLFNTLLILIITAALGFSVLYVHAQFRLIHAENAVIGGFLSDLYDNQVAIYDKVAEEHEAQQKLKDSLAKPTYEFLKSVTVFIVKQNTSDKEKAWLGTGVIVKITNDATYILTNRHVCDGELGYQCTVYEGKSTYRATAIKVSQTDFDMALLKVDTVIPKKQAVNGITVASIQEPVYMVGNNQGRPFIYAEGVVAGYDIENNKSLLVDISAAPGNSGSGIINKKGELVGLLWGGTVTGEPPFMAPDFTHALCVDGRVLKLFLAGTV